MVRVHHELVDDIIRCYYHGRPRPHHRREREQQILIDNVINGYYVTRMTETKARLAEQLEIISKCSEQITRMKRCLLMNRQQMFAKLTHPKAEDTGVFSGLPNDLLKRIFLESIAL